MSKENLEQFMSKVADSEELQDIIEEIDAEALIALGAECGYEFTAGELQEFARWIERNDTYSARYLVINSQQQAGDYALTLGIVSHDTTSYIYTYTIIMYNKLKNTFNIVNMFLND